MVDPDHLVEYGNLPVLALEKKDGGSLATLANDISADIFKLPELPEKGKGTVNVLVEPLEFPFYERRYLPLMAGNRHFFGLHGWLDA
jgi:hypothetical protein